MKLINLTTIDLNLLAMFEVLYEEQSVTAAAQRLHLGQPAVSSALGRLRTLLQDELFVRVGREMKPTAKAEAIAPKIMAALEQIRVTLASHQTFDPASAQRTFAMASSDYISTVVIPTLLTVMHQQAPGIDLRLSVVEKESFVDLLGQGQIELALGTFTELPPTILSQGLMQERFVGLCRQGHPALVENRISLEVFVAFPHALFTLRRDTTGLIDRALLDQGLQRRVALTTPYWSILPPAIVTSDLLVAVPSQLAPQFMAQHPLAQFEIPLDLPPWSISMVWSKLRDRDPANVWMRTLIHTICTEI